MNNNCRIAFIFARGGSKGVPGKNIKILGGIPLIAHTIQSAQKSSLIDRIIVSTDDEDIATVSNDFGAEVPFIRPGHLASDTSSELDAWKHAVVELNTEFDVFISLPPTAPLRSVGDINRCIHVFEDTDADMVITVKEASRNPFFNMVKMDSNDYAQLVINQSEGGSYIRRQDTPKVYDMTTVAYVSSPKHVLQMKTLFSGKTRSVIIPDNRAVDIDTQLDFEITEFLLGGKEE